MRNKATLTFFVGVVVFGIIVGMVILQIEENKAGKSISSPQVTTSSSAISDQQGSYILLLNEQMIAMSDAIFKGMVVSFSATRWNQDSGEAWESTSNSDEIPLQLHYLKVEVLQSIVDDIGLSREINVTVLNPAPVGDDEIDIYSLREGDEAIFFIVQTEMVWRSGMKPIYRLTNAPWVSYYLLGEDNLYHSELLPQSLSFEEVVADVATKRETLFQP